MAHKDKKRPASTKRRSEKFQNRRGCLRTEWAAKKQLKRLEAKQKKNQARGRKGHTPVERKILKTLKK